LFGGEPSGVSEAAFEVLKREIPYFVIAGPAPVAIGKLIEVLTGPDGLFESKKDAKRAIQQGGFYVNKQRVTPEQAEIESSALLHGRFLLVQKGNKNYALVEVTT